MEVKKTIVVKIMILFSFLAYEADGQTNYSEKQRLVLEALSASEQRVYDENKTLAFEVARQRGVPVVKLLSNDRIAFLDGVTEAGDLLYVAPDNAKASVATGTNQLNGGGRLGVGLEGKGLAVGVWEVGIPNIDHVEFKTRIVQRDGLWDQVTAATRDHATHVIGTIGASGVNPNAKGMAPAATIISLTAQNDNAEMALEAAGGLLVSNHSYGFIRGWDGDTWYGNSGISDQEDYLFGFYDSEARVWDNIATNAPYYLIVKSAGNERGDYGPGYPGDCNGGEGYDCISHGAVAKNVLTVGAVRPLSGRPTDRDDIEMSSFSSWGPTDDGRIKPDLVGVGVNVFSSGGADSVSYMYLQGTSMAAPNVAGSLILLQELHVALHGRYMLSSSLKALAIHTALDGGMHPGPDYVFGWGLLDADRAALLLTRSNSSKHYVFVEDTLKNNQTVEFELESLGGDIAVTLAWLDPAGEAMPASLDPRTPNLVKDLDIRLIAPNATTYMPWKLDPSSPAAPATNDDNTLDNVEKIEVRDAPAGTYRIVISHKGNLGGSGQSFSLFAHTGTLTDDNQVLYWVGGDGSWHDPDNWSLTEGGGPVGVVPDGHTRVIISDKSISGGGRMDIGDGAECLSLTVVGKQEIELVVGGTMLVHEHLIISNESAILSGYGIFKLTNNVPYNSIVKIIPPAPTLRIEFEGDYFAVNSALHAQTIKIVRGNTRFLSGATLTADSVYTKTNLEAKSVWGDILSIVDGSYVDLSDPYLSINLKRLNTRFRDTGKQKYALSLCPFENLFVENETDSLLMQTLSAALLKNSGTIWIAQSMVIDSLMMTEGSHFLLHEDIVVKVNTYFDVQSAGSKLTTIQSSGGGVLDVSISGVRRFCLSPMYIKDVSLAGPTPVFVGDSSVIEGVATGWIAKNCADALFPDFIWELACAGGLTRFFDVSTGNPRSWQWTFGDVASGSDNFSNEQNPHHEFETPGVYTVTLVISSDTEHQTYFQEVVILENTLSDPTIESTPNLTLFSGVSAPYYQWYVNGELIEGANTKFLDFGGEGVYTLEIQDDFCSKLSAPFVILSVDEPSRPCRVYPNPSMDQVFFTCAHQNGLVVEVRDTFGRPVLRATLRIDESLDISSLAPGVYFGVISGYGQPLRFIKGL